MAGIVINILCRSCSLPTAEAWTHSGAAASAILGGPSTSSRNDADDRLRRGRRRSPRATAAQRDGVEDQLRRGHRRSASTTGAPSGEEMAFREQEQATPLTLHGRVEVAAAGARSGAPASAISVGPSTSSRNDADDRLRRDRRRSPGADDHHGASASSSGGGTHWGYQAGASVYRWDYFDHEPRAPLARPPDTTTVTTMDEHDRLYVRARAEELLEEQQHMATISGHPLADVQRAALRMMPLGLEARAGILAIQLVRDRQIRDSEPPAVPHRAQEFLEFMMNLRPATGARGASV